MSLATPTNDHWRRRSPVRALGLLLAGLIAVLLAAPCAHADSLVYVKNGQPWVSAPDGSDAHLVTNDGATYQFVSVTDDGTVWAVSDNEANLFPPGAPEEATSYHVTPGLGLESFAVAPDGSAMGWMMAATSLIDHVTFVHNVETQRISDGNEESFLGEGWPDFADPTQMLMTGAGGTLDYDATANLQRSVSVPSEVTMPAEFVADRAEDKIAIRQSSDVYGFDPSSTLLFLAFANGTYTAACQLNSPVPAEKLTWSSDGSLIAWQEADGIHEMRIGTIDSACADANFTDLGLVIPGGSSPDFGPSGDRRFPNAPASSSPPPGAPSPGPGAPGAPGPKHDTSPTNLKPKLTTSATGVTLTLSCPSTKASCTAIATLRTVLSVTHGRKRVKKTVVIGSGHATFAGGHVKRLSVALNRAGREDLARVKHLTITVTIAASDTYTGHRTVVLSARLTYRRPKRT